MGQEQDHPSGKAAGGPLLRTPHRADRFGPVLFRRSHPHRHPNDFPHRGGAADRWDGAVHTGGRSGHDPHWRAGRRGHDPLPQAVDRGVGKLPHWSHRHRVRARPPGPGHPGPRVPNPVLIGAVA